MFLESRLIFLAQDGATHPSSAGEAAAATPGPIDLKTASPEALKKPEARSGLPPIPEVVDAAFLAQVKAKAQEDGKKRADGAILNLKNLELPNLTA